MTPWLTVVGMGDDGPEGLAPAARAVVEQARVVVGGRRHLDRLGPGGREHIPWPKPFDALADVLQRLRDRAVCVLATGDPTCYGVGSILAERFGPDAVRIIPAPSAFSLACARLGWAAQGVQTLSLHGRPLQLVQPFIQPDARLLALSANADTPGEVARMLRERGYGGSRLTVLSHLGGANERIHTATAAAYRATDAVADLNTLAIECVADPAAPLAPRTPGLADALFEHDGQLTKREVRAITLAALGPVPGPASLGHRGRLRLHRHRMDARAPGLPCHRHRAECRPRRDDRRERRRARHAGHRDREGTSGRGTRRVARARRHLRGGGITEPGVLERCWSRLQPGGRLVANVVSVEGETVLDAWQRAHGGSLTRIAIARCAPLGRFRGWRPMMPVTQLAATRGAKEER